MQDEIENEDQENIKHHSLRFIEYIHEATYNTHLHHSILKKITDSLKTGYVDINYINSRGPLLNALLVTINNGAFYWTYFLLLNGADPLIPFQLDDHIYYHRFSLSQLRILLMFGLPLSVVKIDMGYMISSIRNYIKKDHWSVEVLLYLFDKKGLNSYYLY